MKLGDTVFHRPSGETWIVAHADETEVMPVGWPETIAKRSDCDLVEHCSEEEHAELLGRYRQKKDKTDLRTRLVLGKYGEG